MTSKINMVTTGALFFLAAGIFTSVSILSAYQILFTLSLIYFTYLAFKEKSWQLPKSAYWLLAFSLVALLSTTINVDIIPKPSKNFGRIKYFIYGAWGIYVFRYWLMTATDKTKKILTMTFFLSIVVAGLYVIFRYTTDVLIAGTDGRGRPLTETMQYGYGSGMILLTILSLILHREKLGKWFDHRWAVAAFIIGFIGMYLTHTRGALLGFIVGLPFVIYFYRPKWGLFLAGLAVIGVGIVGSIYLFGSGNYQSRFLMNKNNSSDVMRRSQWQAAIIAIKERPVLGWGLSNFHSQLPRIKNDYDLPAKEYNDAHAHNVFLEVGAGTGLIGLFLLCGWLISWAIESFKAGLLTRAIILPFGAAFVVSSQFEVTFDANNASMIFALYSLSAAIGFQSKKETV